MNDVDDILEHFGVKGMKWGVRNINRSAKRCGRICQSKVIFRRRRWYS
jgi:hypothetical protein